MSSERFSSCDDEERRHRELLAVLDRAAFAMEQIAQAIVSVAQSSLDPREVLRAQVAREKRAAAEAVSSETEGPQARKKDRT